MKIVRSVVEGSMRVYFDDLEKPVLTASDKRFCWGKIGLGTFDDHGNFDNIQLRGRKVQRTD